MFVNYGCFILRQCHSLCGFHYHWWVSRRQVCMSPKACPAILVPGLECLTSTTEWTLLRIEHQTLPTSHLCLPQFISSESSTTIRPVIESSNLKFILHYSLFHSVHQYGLQLLPLKQFQNHSIYLHPHSCHSVTTIISHIHFCHSLQLVSLSILHFYLFDSR